MRWCLTDGHSDWLMVGLGGSQSWRRRRKSSKKADFKKLGKVWATMPTRWAPACHWTGMFCHQNSWLDREKINWAWKRICTSLQLCFFWVLMVLHCIVSPWWIMLTEGAACWQKPGQPDACRGQERIPLQQLLPGAAECNSTPFWVKMYWVPVCWDWGLWGELKYEANEVKHVIMHFLGSPKMVAATLWNSTTCSGVQGSVVQVCLCLAVLALFIGLLLWLTTAPVFDFGHSPGHSETNFDDTQVPLKKGGFCPGQCWCLLEKPTGLWNGEILKC